MIVVSYVLSANSQITTIDPFLEVIEYDSLENAFNTSHMVMGLRHGGSLSNAAFTPYGLKIHKQVHRILVNALRLYVWDRFDNTIKFQLFANEAKDKNSATARRNIKRKNIDSKINVIFKAIDTIFNQTQSFVSSKLGSTSASFKRDRNTINELVDHNSTTLDFKTKVDADKVEVAMNVDLNVILTINRVGDLRVQTIESIKGMIAGLVEYYGLLLAIEHHMVGQY